MLVSAFAGYENIKKAYDHAIQQQYRFFSYGDAMFLSRLWNPLASNSLKKILVPTLDVGGLIYLTAA